MFIVFAKKEQDTSIESQIETIAKVKKFLKTNSIVKEICEQYGMSLGDLDGVTISFERKLDVTAKTIDGKISLNSSLMDEKFEIICRYVVHELTHVFQHMKKEFSKDKNRRNKEYLDRPEEIEAFQNQIKFDAKVRTKKDAIEYVDALLEYHKIKNKKEKAEKRKLLLEKLK